MQATTGSGLIALGLVLATGGAFILLYQELKERKRRLDFLSKLQALVKQRAAWERNLLSVTNMLSEVNERLGRKAEDIQARTSSIRVKIAELDADIAALDDIDKQVMDAMLPLTHPAAIFLIGAGLFFQLVGTLAG